jgi:hypothetical protein
MYLKLYIFLQILRHILDYLPITSLKVLRHVSTLWNKECCFLLQNMDSLVITFNTVAEVVEYTDNFIQSSDLPQDFPYPHSRYQFHKIRLHLIYDNYKLRKFFKSFGSRIKHLHLDLTGKSFRLKFLRVSIWNSLEQHNQLKSLSLFFKDFHHLWPWSLQSDQPLTPLASVTSLAVNGVGSDATLIKTLMTSIVQCLPNLTDIFAGKQQSKILFDILYGSPSTSVSLPGLNRFHFSCLSSSQIKTIVAQRVQLEELRAVLHEKVEISEVKCLLAHLSTTLKRLYLESSHLSFPAVSVEFQRLNILELKQVVCNLAVLTKNVFPKLENLKLISSELHWTENSAEILQLNDSVEVVTIDTCLGLNSKGLSGIARLFPNLRRLDIPAAVIDCEDNLLSTICEEMVNLEELYVSHDTISDESVTGIPLKICRKMLEEMKYGKKYPKETVDQYRAEGVSWIRNLKSKTESDLDLEVL